MKTFYSTFSMSTNHPKGIPSISTAAGGSLSDFPGEYRG